MGVLCHAGIAQQKHHPLTIRHFYAPEIEDRVAYVCHSVLSFCHPPKTLTVALTFEW
jgi:hypothetical protein